MEQAVVTAAERRKARAAISALFFTNGALLGSLVLRFPEIKDAFGLSSSVYGAPSRCHPWEEFSPVPSLRELFVA